MRAYLFALLLAPLPAPALADAHTERAADEPASSAPIEASLVAAGEQWRTLYEAGDWDALRTLYTEDAVLMANNSAKVEGRDDIIAFLRRLSDAGGSAAMQFDAEEAIIEGEYGFVTAKYRMDITLPGSDPNAIAGRSLLIYKWQGGAWKLWRDIDNFAPDVTPDYFEDSAR